MHVDDAVDVGDVCDQVSGLQAASGLPASVVTCQLVRLRCVPVACSALCCVSTQGLSSFFRRESLCTVVLDALVCLPLCTWCSLRRVEFTAYLHCMYFLRLGPVGGYILFLRSQCFADGTTPRLIVGGPMLHAHRTTTIVQRE